MSFYIIISLIITAIISVIRTLSATTCQLVSVNPNIKIYCKCNLTYSVHPWRCMLNTKYCTKGITIHLLGLD